MYLVIVLKPNSDRYMFVTMTKQNTGTNISNKKYNFFWLLETFVFPSDTDDYQVWQKHILISLYFATGEENWNHKYDFISPDMHKCTRKGSETGLLSGKQLCNDDLQITKLSQGTS